MSLDLQETLDAIWEELAEVNRRMSSVVRSGTVKSYDPKTNKAVVNIGFDTHEIPAMSFGGKAKYWSPLAAGQQITVLAPDGNLENAVVLPGGFCDAFKAPSNRADEDVMQRGEGDEAAIIRIRDNGVVRLDVKNLSSLKIRLGDEKKTYQLVKAALLPTTED